ncbi:cutinase transcription factor 1 beta [Trichoderma gamsii]|uniref:Cutinase transcription factor 1 beta n=1 Tax=Trichoderma gamsii TaxID=398673 RepID=A0A2P4ZJB5_9HYPO|nr:cutinase transcription factor 1 beta [Trichoderma gamsii]PON24374.1 cutinase transcription factor 1 beta [Trichoderma gamsii]
MAHSDEQTPPSTAASSTRKKKRASKACSCCRARKIRCDVLKTGVPCTKCQLDGFDCLVQARKKRRGKNEPAKEQPSSNDDLRIGDAARPPAMPRSIPQHAMLHQVPHYPFFRSFAPDGQSSLLAVSQDDEDDSGAIKHSRLDEDDIQYLRRKGALSLPPKRVMDEFVSNYFQLFHPFFPIIDKSSFLEGYYKNDRNAALQPYGTSLLLLQAIIFTASATVPASTLRAAGFTSRKEARNQLHKRARYLYDFDFESDDITNIQALLLMSHYYPSMVEQKHTWFWVHQAISLSQGLGLHRNAGQEPQHKLWARIWWACLVRDRLTTLGTGRPMHINSLDCTVPMLTLDDLKEDGDSEDDRTVKEFFIEFVKLCQYMEGVLSLPHNIATAAGSLPEQISLCEETLQHWRLNLVPSAKLHEENSRDFDKRGICTLYRALLHLIYNIVIIALHKSHQVLDESRPSGAQLPLPRVQAAAEDSTRLAVELVRLDLIKYCPTICVTAILPPLIVHLLMMRSSPDSSSRQPHIDRFSKCMVLLEQLGDIYWHASFYHDFFKLAASQSQEPTAHASATEQDPLVAFFNDHMPAKQPAGKGVEISIQAPNWRRPPTANNAENNPIKLTAAQGQDDDTADHSSMLVTTADIQAGILATAPTLHTTSTVYETDPGDLELGDVAVSDAANLQLFEDWLDEFGYFQNIFQSA